MCRKNQLIGFCAGAFGLGLLVGHCIESGFLSICIGVGLMIIGFSLIRQK